MVTAVASARRAIAKRLLRDQSTPKKIKLSKTDFLRTGKIGQDRY